MKPTNETELAEVIASATRPIQIVGGGTRSVGNSVVGDPLYTGGLSGITLYEPGALTIVAKAGTPLAEIEATLAAEGQRLPFEPIDMRGIFGTAGDSTIGGVVATNASGPRRIQAGACRDSLIGVRFVDGQGNLLKNGGRVMKNVTGYDLVKLMSGSYGTLGVLTEVSFKVLPAPETRATVVVEGLSDVEAIKTLSAALGSSFDVNGAAHVPATGQTAVRVEGLSGSVAYRADELIKKIGGTITEFDWNSVRDVSALASSAGDIWRFSVKPSDGPQLGQNLRAAGTSELLYDWGGGLVWALSPAGTDLRAAMGAISGNATLIRGEGQTVFHPEAAPIELLNKGLRAKFDPKSILNEGRMG